MTTHRAKGLILLTVVLLCALNRSFAAIYYVNVNNPTPGSGLTWATAFTNLNLALATAGNGDQIWVAKGTYKPTTTTDRTMTFTIAQGYNIYGGFNGTETAVTMANPTANPTILSGDIGVVGDPTDNSYHVVTYQSVPSTNITMDGFTITGGNANADYPASTTPEANNTGGGFFELGTAGQTESAVISHCTFTANFAVNGGGFAAYGDNASQTFYSIVYCNFTNNTAWMGGAGASLGYNNDLSVSGYDMCVFENNGSLNSQGSVIATLYTNGTSAEMLTMVTNSVVYNNAEPQFYNLTTNGDGHLQIYTSIIWNSTAPYAGPIYTGNNILVDLCDIDLVTPLGSNLDVDPQFTNAAGGDFHTPHCGPLVDQGFTTASFNIGTTDPDGNPRLLGPKTDIGLYESQLPPAPTGSNVAYCQNATAVPLTATALAGNSLLWYTVSTGGTGSATPITPSTNVASPFATYYYVSQVDAQGCEGPRYPIGVTINAGAAAPTAASPTYCQGAAAVPLTATGSNLLWYTVVGGTGSASAPTPVTTSTGSTDYYVTQTPSGSCESAPVTVAVTIEPGASAPAAVSPTYCQGVTASPLSATGSNLLWYTTIGGTGSGTAPTPVTTSVGSTDYYVTQTPAGSCESTPSTVTVTIGALAASPAVVSPTYCQGVTAAPLSATGSNLLWYTVIGGAGSASAPTPVTTSTGSTDYYVTQTPAGSCESTPSTVTVTIEPGAAAPTAVSPTYCAGSTPTPLSATGTGLLWYTTIGGTGSGIAPTPITTSTGSTDYYVTQTPAGSCESTPSTVTVTVEPGAAAPVAVSPMYCQGITAAPLSATGSNLLWYTTIGGTGSASAPTPVTTSTGSTDYYVTQTPAGSCESTPSTVTVTIEPAAAAPTGVSPTYCAGSTPTPLSATGTGLLWYSNPTGGVGITTAPMPSTIYAGVISYYVTQTPPAGCESVRTEIDVTTKPNPSAEFTWSNACEGAPTTITASSTSADLYVWDFAEDASATGSGSGPYEVTWTSANTYTVTLTTTANGCEGQTQHQITVNPNPKVGIAQMTTPLCVGKDVSLEAYGASTYQWSPVTNLSNPDVADPIATLQNGIQYTVTGTDGNGCSASASVTLDISADCLAYDIPDAFTPNGDGKNDEFYVITQDAPKVFDLIIFNRYGGKIFESASVGTRWNGTIGGSAEAPAGTYVYVLRAVSSVGAVIKKEGTVVLIR